MVRPPILEEWTGEGVKDHTDSSLGDTLGVSEHMPNGRSPDDAHA